MLTSCYMIITKRNCCLMDDAAACTRCTDGILPLPAIDSVVGGR